MAQSNQHTLWGITLNSKSAIKSITFSLFFLLVLLFLCSRVVYGGLAPDFTLTDIDGKNFSLSRFRGKVVILDFFATYCSPCRDEMSQLNAVYNEFSGKLVIISISVWNQDTDEKLRQFREDYGITWILARDTANVRGKYNVPTIPTLCIIDQDGYIRYNHVGYTRASVLIEEIGELLNVSPIVSLTVTTSPSLDHVHFRVDGDDYYTSGGSFSVELEVGQHQVQLVDTVIIEDPYSEYHFSHWSGIGSGSSNPKQIEITTSSALEAVFDTISYYEIVFTQSGSGRTPHVTVDGALYVLPQTFWFDSGSSHSFSYESEVSGGTGIRYVLTSESHTSPITVTSSTTVTGYYETQYYVTVTSAHGSPTPSQWVDAEGSLTVSVTSPEDNGAGTRHKCTGWTGTGSVPATGTSTSVTFTMTSPSSITWNWIPQYRITFTESGLEAGRSITITVNGTPHSETSPFSYSEWYDKDFSVAFSITGLIDSADSGKRYTLINWRNGAGSSIASPQTVSGPEIFTAYYQTQHYLIVNTNPSGLNPQPYVSPSGPWYDIGALVICTAQAADGYDFHYWVLDGTPQEAGNIELTITMDMPRNATAHYTATTDLNLDGTVDEADLSMIASTFQSEIGDEDYDPRMDLDGNGAINILDVTKVATEFEKTT